MRKQDEIVTLSKEQRAAAAAALKEYINENISEEFSGLQADGLLNVIGKSIAPLYYNHAVADCAAFMADKADELYTLMKNEDER